MIMPSLIALEKVPGVSLSIIESVKIHFLRLIQLLSLQAGRYTLKAKEGLDGSGRHNIYDQQGSYDTNNMIIWMWVPLSLSKDVLPMASPSQPSFNQCEFVWQESSSSSPEAARPILTAIKEKHLITCIFADTGCSSHEGGEGGGGEGGIR